MAFRVMVIIDKIFKKIDQSSRNYLVLPRACLIHDISIEFQFDTTIRVINYFYSDV